MPVVAAKVKKNPSFLRRQGIHNNHGPKHQQHQVFRFLQIPSFLRRQESIRSFSGVEETILVIPAKAGIHLHVNPSFLRRQGIHFAASSTDREELVIPAQAGIHPFLLGSEDKNAFFGKRSLKKSVIYNLTKLR